MSAKEHEPRKVLLMNLKLVQGVQFSNPLGEILVTIPEVLEKTIITKWQYRMLLGLDGSQPFIDVVKEVKGDFEGAFAAADIWMFLDWLIETKLVTADELTAVTDNFDANPILPRLIAPTTPSHQWVRVPLQIIAVLFICVATTFAAYFATPIVLSSFSDEPETPASPELASIKVADPIALAEAQAVRLPVVTEPKEVTVAAAVVPKPSLSDMPKEPSLVDKLISMRREMAACQIRRDEYYLLNNEEGYSAEVDRITELVREIGKIRADITK